MILMNRSSVWLIFFHLSISLNIAQSGNHDPQESESETKIEDRYLGEMEHLEPGL